MEHLLWGTWSQAWLSHHDHIWLVKIDEVSVRVVSFESAAWGCQLFNVNLGFHTLVDKVDEVFVTLFTTHAYISMNVQVTVRFIPGYLLGWRPSFYKVSITLLFILIIYALNGLFVLSDCLIELFFFHLERLLLKLLCHCFVDLCENLFDQKTVLGLCLLSQHQNWVLWLLLNELWILVSFILQRMEETTFLTVTSHELGFVILVLIVRLLRDVEGIFRLRLIRGKGGLSCLQVSIELKSLCCGLHSSLLI